MYYFRFRCNRFKHVPKRNFFISLFFLVLTLYSLFCILQPQELLLQNSQEVRLPIESIKLVGGKSKGSKQYTVVSNGQSYYFVYYCKDPKGNSEHKLFGELLENSASNKRIVIDATITTEQTLSDTIYNRYRILCMTIDGAECLSLSTTQKHMMNVYCGAWFGFVLFGTCLLLCVLFNIVGYGIIEINNAKTRKSPVDPK